MHRYLPAVGAVAAILITPLAAQNWVEIITSNSPPGVAGHGMAFDLANNRTVLFGGNATGFGNMNQTWLFDGTNWSQATPTTSPPVRAGHPLAYDVVRSRVVLFGGISGAALNDTWEWDGTTWLQMTPATVPPARLSHPLVYHPGRGTCVMHGGNGLGAGTLTDTWEWNGINWQQIVTANYPLPLRYATDMAYDPIGNGLVLFSGYPGSTPDTWYFDNVNWALRPTTTVPPGRYDHTLTTDPVRGRVVMFGGTNVADTWEFDGTDWINAAPATLPPARFDDYMVYDTVRGQVIMFGGGQRNDTWVMPTPAQPGHAAATPYGAGCLNQYASFQESYAACDLSNTSLSMTNTGTGYVVLPGTTPLYVPTTTPIVMGDDVVIAFPLGWTLPYPGGSTNTLSVSSNGFVHGAAQAANGCCAFQSTMFLTLGPCWAAKWRDLNPSAGGTVHFDTDPISGTAYVTFNQIVDYGSTNANTFQYAFQANGTVELRFGTMAQTSGTTGWSPGANNLLPPSIDISAQSVIITGANDQRPLSHGSNLRPILGNSLTLRTTNVPNGSPLGATVFGLLEHNPGIDLTAAGMPGCYQHLSTDAVHVWVPAAGVGSSTFTIPNVTTFVGVAIKTQGAALAPGINATGAITSNGLRLSIDVN